MTAKLEKRQPTLDAEIDELRERRVTTQEKHSAAVIALTAARVLRANGQFRTLFPDMRRESSRFLSDRLQNCSLQIAGKKPSPIQPAVVLLVFGLSRVRLATLQAWLVDG